MAQLQRHFAPAAFDLAALAEDVVAGVEVPRRLVEEGDDSSARDRCEVALGAERDVRHLGAEIAPDGARRSQQRSFVAVEPTGAKDRLVYSCDTTGWRCMSPVLRQNCIRSRVAVDSCTPAGAR